MCVHETGSSIPNWITAFGTVFAVIVALFGEAIRRSFYKPQLDVEISTDFPHCRLIKRGSVSESDSSSDVVEICVSVENIKQSAASNCRVLIQNILVSNAGGGGVSDHVKFRPQLLEWDNQPPGNSGCEMDVVQGLPCYIKIAEIMKPQNAQMNNESSARSSHSEKAILAIAIKDQNGQSPYAIIPPEQASVFVSLKILGHNIVPLDKDVQIDWKGAEVCDYSTPSKFQVRVLSEEESKELAKKRSV